MMLISNDRSSRSARGHEAGTQPDPKLVAAIGEHAERLRKSGVLVDSGELLPSSTGAWVWAAGGKLSATDGPFVGSIT